MGGKHTPSSQKSVSFSDISFLPIINKEFSRTLAVALVSRGNFPKKLLKSI